MASFTKVALLALVFTGSVSSDVSLTGTAPEDDVSLLQLGADVRERSSPSSVELTTAEQKLAAAEKLFAKMSREIEDLKAANQDLEEENSLLRSRLDTCQ